MIDSFVHPSSNILFEWNIRNEVRWHSLSLFFDNNLSWWKISMIISLIELCVSFFKSCEVLYCVPSTCCSFDVDVFWSILWIKRLTRWRQRQRMMIIINGMVLSLAISITIDTRNERKFKEKPIYICEKYFRLLLLLLLPETINIKCFAVIIIDGGIFSLLKIDFYFRFGLPFHHHHHHHVCRLTIDDHHHHVWRWWDDDDQAKSIYPQHFWWFEYCGGGQTPIFFDN